MNQNLQIRNSVFDVKLVAVFGLVIVASGAAIVSAQSVTLPKKSVQVIRLEKKIVEQEDQLKRYSEQKKVFEKQLSVLNQDFDKLQKQQDDEGVSPDSFSEILKSLQAQRVELLIDLAGMNARRDAVFELKKQMSVSSDSIVAGLKELLKLEEDELARAQKLYEMADISKSEYQKVKSRILELKIRMAEAQKPQKSASLLNDELLNSSLDRAEKKARLEKIESLLVSFTKARSTLEQTAIIQRKIKDTRSSVIRVESNMALTLNIIDQLTKQVAELNSPKSSKQEDQ